MRDYWSPEKFRAAARLLTDAANHCYTSYPNSEQSPDPTTLVAVRAMIDASLKCIEEAQPQNKK